MFIKAATGTETSGEDAALDRYRALASAVILRAIKDVHERGPGSVRECARSFLSPNDEMFNVYCGLLGYDPRATVQAIRRRGKNVARRIPRVDVPDDNAYEHGRMGQIDGISRQFGPNSMKNSQIRQGGP